MQDSRATVEFDEFYFKDYSIKRKSAWAMKADY